MKIGVLSDTHLSRVSPELIHLVEVLFKDVDLILHAGDIVSGEVLAYLEDHGAVAVRGNMDRAEVAGVLPIKRVIAAGGFRIGLIHGFGAPRGLAEALRTEFGELDGWVFGHSHEPMNRRVRGELWFNPGAPGGSAGTAGLIHVTDKLEGEIIRIQSAEDRDG